MMPCDVDKLLLRNTLRQLLPYTSDAGPLTINVPPDDMLLGVTARVI
jgi:hypothetical protein